MIDTQLYEVELWSRLGVLVADISIYVKSMNFSMERNQAEDLTLELDLNAFEYFADSIGVFPTSMLGAYSTDVKIKRRGQYLFGTHVGNIETSMGETEQTITVKCFGYFNLLIDRYVTKNYVQEYETDIAWDLINETQSQTNGDMGITQGPNQVQLVLRDRNYERQMVKDGIFNLTNLATGNFDFEITVDKEFNTYEMIGSDRPELEFIYPGNIVSVRVPRSGTSISNKIIGLGAGFGNDQLQSTQSDNDSQLNHGVHEKIMIWNSIINQEPLDENVLGQLNIRKSILEIPQMTVYGSDFDLNEYGIGDRVTVRIEEHKFLQTVSGTYRIEKINVVLDENQSELITIYFDDILTEATNE
jgi:hypothetical protein